MRISIITVCLNSEKTIEQTIKSVLSQNYDDVEYLIIDGVSTDGTMEIVEKYREQLSVVVSEPDKGLYDAMNKGIALATGDVIGIINSDDWYEPGVFEIVRKEFMDEHVEVLHAQQNLIRDGIKKRVKEADNIEVLRYRMALNHPTVFVRKKIYEKYGVFDTKYMLCADYELLLRFYVNSVNFKYVERIFANFRMTGLSNTYDKQKVIDVYNIAMHYLLCVPYNEEDYYKKKIEEEYLAQMWGYVLIQQSHETLAQIIEKTGIETDTPIILFGAGSWGVKMCVWLQNNGIMPLCFVDNDPIMWNEKILGIQVMAPECVNNIEGTLLIMVKYHSKEIMEQIKQMRTAFTRVIRWEELLGNNV